MAILCENDGDYESLRYHLSISVASNGLALAVVSLLFIYERAEQTVREIRLIYIHKRSFKP